jgi:hypothetical protein
MSPPSPSPSPPAPILQVDLVRFSDEDQMMEFTYECPENSGGSCKKCASFVEEDDVKKSIVTILMAENWIIDKTAMGKTHGVDIAAKRPPNEIILVEAKGEGSLNPMRVNYFLMVLGELIQKMDSPNKYYGIGLPAHRQFGRLITKLPRWIKQYLKLRIFLVKRLGKEKYLVGYLTYQ